MSKVCTAREAVSLIKTGESVACTGVIGWLAPDALLKALSERFVETAEPRDLSFFFPVSVGDAMQIRGMDYVAKEGLMKRIVSGNYLNTLDPVTGSRPQLMRLIRENRVEAYCWPIGATMHWLREVARRGPGYITKVGLGSYIDPRQTGGKYTARAQADLVRVIQFEGEEYLYYPTWPLNVAFIRASSADEFGNLSFEDEPLISSAISMALATKACGGRVIAQVQRIVPRSSRAAQAVRVPGDLVDHVVVAADQLMTTQTQHDATYLGGRYGGEPSERTPLTADKIIARRAAADIRPGVVTIFGFGASSDIPAVMAEQGLFRDDGLHRYRFTTEHGSFGGMVMGGWKFSANSYPEALLDGPSQFDFIDGGNCQVAALAFAELDRNGNVNVSRFGTANPGPGGFIDIARNARELLFTGTFTTGGLKVRASGGKLEIVEEGRVKKFVQRAGEITYPLLQNIDRHEGGARIYTERAVFSVKKEGLVLIEVAPGIDVRRDVLDLMEFPPVHIDEHLVRMDASLFEA